MLETDIQNTKSKKIDSVIIKIGKRHDMTNTSFAMLNEQLKDKVLYWAIKAGRLPTAINGLMVTRREEANELRNFFYNPLVGITLQGSKRSLIGTDEYRYGEGYCMIAGVDIPSASYITDVTSEKPFLAISLDLDRSLAAEIASQLPAFTKPKGINKPVAVAKVDIKVMDAFLRLINLLDEPEEIPIMAPMLIREIHYRLLIGEQGEWLRMVCTLGTNTNKIAQAISWLRHNFKQTLHIEDLAQSVNMATSTFHRHFKETTGISPLQFQKQLRLYEAQRLMLFDKIDVNQAAFAVGYESSTQFIREYKRVFGVPPRQDIIRLTTSN